MGFFSNLGKFFTGSPEKREQVSTLRRGQEPGYRDLQRASQGKYGQGAFGQAGQYYSDLMGNDSADFNAFAAPQMRQFNEETIPELSEQFAGMGSGGLSSSGFRNAAVGAGTDLSERLGSMRAQLRQRGAEGLQNIGNSALGNFSQNQVTQQGSQGFLSNMAPAIGTGIGTAIGGPIGGAVGNWAGSMVGKNTSPYGGPQQGGIGNR